MIIRLKHIGIVRNQRTEIIDDNWGEIISEIELSKEIIEESFEGIDDFSHLEIIFYFDKVEDAKAIPQYRHPRNNTDFPKLGTYAQRNKNRPNKLGLTTVELVERKGRSIFVKQLDAINGTPVLDIKPVMAEFEPKGAIVQPEWSKSIMKNYW